VTPSGDQLLVAAPAERLVSILERCDGTSSFDELAAASAQPSVTLRLLGGLLAAGCLTTMERELSTCLDRSR